MRRRVWRLRSATMALIEARGLAPRLSDVLAGLACWLVGCDLRGQFCQRCGRFVP